MSDKYLILDRDTFTDKRMTGYLAALTDESALLNFNKSADFGVVTNSAPVEINEFRKLYILS